MQLQKSILICITAIALVFSSCGIKKRGEDQNTITDKDNPLSALKKLSDNAEKVKEDMDDSQKMQEDRKKRGDTLAMNYKELQKYLPETIAGYEKDGEPGGQSVNMAGMSYSTASQKFKKEADYIEVTVTDYNQAYGTFQGLFSYAGMFSVESDEEKTTKYNTGVEHTLAIESYKKKDKDATITAGAGYRFWIEVKGNNQPDAEFLKKVLAGMKLKELAGM
jgi:predicted ribosome quality control (RQC) complex YloA/Tae2 family protein